MKTFFVDVPEDCICKFRVEANSKEEAIEKVLNDDYIDVDYIPGTLDLDTNTWEIVEHEN